MTHIIRNRLALFAVAAFAALVATASPASATDDPAPRAPAPSTGAPAPSTSTTTIKTKAGKVRVRVRYRKRRAGACGGFRISVSGAGTSGTTRVDIRAGKRRIGRDRTRPFTLAIGGRKVRSTRKVSISLVGPNGTRRITRRLRKCSTSSRVSAHRSAFEPIPVSMALDALLSRTVSSVV
jgi:hypothetical protein